MRLTTGQALLALAPIVLAFPASNRWTDPKPDLEKAEAVKKVFQLSFDNYYKYAFPNDDLKPVSNTYDNDRNHWGATLVDGVTTAIVMEDKESLKKMLDFIPTIDFTTTKAKNDDISVFETNIRYLGGLLSAHDMLKGPWSHLAPDSDTVDALLKQASTLADSLSIAFTTKSGVPDGTIQLNPKPALSGATSNNLAEAGTLVLEWTRLSDLTGNKTYAELAQRAEDYLINPTGSPEAWPGLVGGEISTENGTFLNSDGGWSGGMDSFYEYLIKMYLYDPEEFGGYKDRWVKAADSTMKHLASHPSTRRNLTFLSQYSGPHTLPESGHLASFAGGNFILGGILLNEKKYIDFGETLVVSYFETYQKATVGIGPEGFSWVDPKQKPNTTNNPLPPANQTAFYESAGWWSTSGQYILRPETMESLWYAYRVTGDRKYQDMAWQGFNAITAATRAGSAYSAINDVMAEDGGGFMDSMESFWLAEALKYMYLVFAEDSPVQFKRDGRNEWVFNTEAHPVQIRG